VTDHQRSLRVTIAESAGGSGSAVACNLDGHHQTTVRELVEIGAKADLWLPPREPWIARAPRTGRLAEPEEPLALLGLTHGDLVEIEAADRTLAGDVPPGTVFDGLELAVTAGPASGHRVHLGSRPITVGRAPGCDLPLADPSLSNEHFRLEPSGSGWAVVDLQSSNGTALDGTLISAGIPASLIDGAEIEAGRSVLTLRPAAAPAAIEATPSDHGEIGVNRPPRMVPAALDVVIDAPEIPAKPSGPRLPLVAAIVPLIGGVAMWQIFHQITFLAFTLLSPVMLLGSFFSDKISGRGDFKKAVVQLGKDRERIAAEAGCKLLIERATRLDRFPDAAEVVRRVLDQDRRLWERRPDHIDHLVLRIGLADLPSELTIAYPKMGGLGRGTVDEALQAEVRKELPEHAALVNVPATVDLEDVGVIGVVGPPAERAALTRWLTLQLAALHSPRDVQFAAILSDDDAADWEWLKWLPHVQDSAVEQIGSVAVATRTLQVSQLLEAIGELQRERLGKRGAGLGGRKRHGPDVVLLVEDAGVHDRAAMADVLARAGDTNVQVLWEAAERHQLPGEVRVIIEVDEGRSRATITDTRTREILTDVTLDGLSIELTEQVATALAPLRDVTQADRGIGALPSISHLADLERLTDPSPEAVAARWRLADGPATFMLGSGPNGPLMLDLVEHGPHALVGGTPGAGKSELLRGVLASLALRYPPSRMTFLLVDFKGGAAFREFAQIPHTVGIVTDLDEHLADRALTSFRAEIKHRESILEQYGAIDVLDLARRAPEVVLPRLLIVIDEFATLAQEVPAFVDGVIDVTQRGRSLGVHLILATQSPRGSVTGKIRANTNLAIALRVVSTDESSDILGTNDAAAIPVQRKGRAWARIGDKDLVPFQSGYVGGHTFGARGKETTVQPFRLDGRTTAAPDPGVGARASAAAASISAGLAPAPPLEATDLEVITEAVAQAWEQSGEAPPRPPWLKELPGELTLEDDRPEGAFGRSDEPRLQRQVPLTFDPAEDGSLIVLGGPRSGKTSTLAMIAGTLAEDHSVDDLHVYGLDCAGRTLAAVEALPHTGSVVPGDDPERTNRLLAMLTSTIQQRRDLASALNAADLQQMREKTDQPLPRLLVLIDDYGGFHERYERVEAGRLLDQLRATISDGPAFGVHFVISADRRSAIPTSVAAAVPRRLIHRMADRDEYARAGLPTNLADTDIPPGRAFTDDAVEVQIATWLSGPEDTLREAFARRGALLGERAPSGAGAPPAAVATLPALVRRTDGPTGLPAFHAFLGLRETELAPVVVDLTHANFVIAGPYRSGRSTTLAVIAKGIAESTEGVELHLVAPRRTQAESRAPWSSITRGSEYKPVVELVEELLDKADEGTPVVLCIDDATEVDPTGMSGLERLLRQARDLPLRVVIAAEAQALRTSYSPWHVQMRKDGVGALLNPNLELDGDLLGARFPWRRAISFPIGRGMYVESGSFDVLQVVGDDEATEPAAN
jgi:S-DNA-T family DNA segregation ATPase FtsK/SpoIIIE